jgi:hypothetical protein
VSPAIEVSDLKLGTGTRIAVGSLVELHYQAVTRADQLDSTEFVQSTWRRNRPLRVRVGRGELRPEIDAALLGVPVGTDRRIVVPPDLWPDLPVGIAIAIYVQTVLEDPPQDDESLAGPLPAWIRVGRAPDTDATLNDIITALDRISVGRSPTGRARLPAREFTVLERSARAALARGEIRYAIGRIGAAEDVIEFEMSRDDAAVLAARMRSDGLPADG